MSAPLRSGFAPPHCRIPTALLCLMFVLPALAYGQLQVAVLRGRVIDPQAQPLARATVQLQDPSGHAVRTAVTNSDGAFRLGDIAPGSYVIRVDVNGTAVLTKPLVVRDSLPVELTLETGVAVAESIVVR